MEIRETKLFEREFVKHLSRDKSLLGDLLSSFSKINSNLPGVNLEHLIDSDFLSFKVRGNSYKAICSQKGNTLILEYFGIHDDAYNWQKTGL